MKKKNITIIIAVILAIITGIIIYKVVANKKPTQEISRVKKRTITEPTNIIDVAERPYITITPKADGKNLVIQVLSLKKDADELDFELEYKSGSLQQGVFGELSLAKLPASINQLLGTCSAGGACTYHEDVTGGTLVTRFRGKENYALKSDWKFIDNSDDQDAFSSRDAKFQITSENLAKANYLIIFNTAGYPGELEGTLVSEIYSLQTTPVITGEAELSIRANQEGELSILGWDGEEWHEFDSSVDGKTVTATVDLMEAYVVVQK